MCDVLPKLALVGLWYQPPLRCLHVVDRDRGVIRPVEFVPLAAAWVDLCGQV